MIDHRNRRNRSARRGLAATELAIILPVLVTLVLAAVDLGRFVSLYIALANAARAGAQYGAMNNYGGSTSSSTYTTWVSNVKSAAQNEIVGQYSGFSGTNNVVVSLPSNAADTGGVKRVRVVASYNFTTAINWNWTGLGLPHTMTMSQQAEVRLVR
jgi:Flp pilus assembly protein TadG